jgi:hypothetical protein
LLVIARTKNLEDEVYGSVSGDEISAVFDGEIQNTHGVIRVLFNKY